MAADKRIVVNTTGDPLDMKRTAVKKTIDVKKYFQHNKKKVFLLTSVAIAIVLLAGYVTWSVLSWQRNSQAATDVRQSIKADVQVLTTQKTTAEKLASESNDAKTSIDVLCTVSPLVEWQSRVFSEAKEAQGNCAHTKQQLQAAQSALGAITQRLTSERQMSEKLQTLQGTLSKIAKDDYAASREAWSLFHADLERISVHSSLQASTHAARDAARDIVVGYDGLIAADSAEKRDEFDGAVAEIEKG